MPLKRFPGEALLSRRCAHDLGGVAADGGVRDRSRIERLADLVEVQERLAEHGELGGSRSPTSPATRASSSTTLPTWIVLELGVLVPPDQIGHSRAELRLVEALPGLAELQRERHRIVAPALADGEQQLQEMLLHPRGDPGHHAEVEQRDLPSSVTNTLPGCGSAWKKPSTRICFRYARKSSRRGPRRPDRAAPRGLSAVILVPEM